MFYFCCGEDIFVAEKKTRRRLRQLDLFWGAWFMGLAMSSKLLHCLFQVVEMIDGDLNLEKWKFCANHQEDIP